MPCCVCCNTCTERTLWTLSGLSAVSLLALGIFRLRHGKFRYSGRLFAANITIFLAATKAARAASRGLPPPPGGGGGGAPPVDVNPELSLANRLHRLREICERHRWQAHPNRAAFTAACRASYYAHLEVYGEDRGWLDYHEQEVLDELANQYFPARVPRYSPPPPQPTPPPAEPHLDAIDLTAIDEDLNVGQQTYEGGDAKKIPHHLLLISSFGIPYDIRETSCWEKAGSAVKDEELVLRNGTRVPLRACPINRKPLVEADYWKFQAASHRVTDADVNFAIAIDSTFDPSWDDATETRVAVEALRTLARSLCSNEPHGGALAAARAAIEAIKEQNFDDTSSIGAQSIIDYIHAAEGTATVTLAIANMDPVQNETTLSIQQVLEELSAATPSHDLTFLGVVLFLGTLSLENAPIADEISAVATDRGAEHGRTISFPLQAYVAKKPECWDPS